VPPFYFLFKTKNSEIYFFTKKVFYLLVVAFQNPQQLASCPAVNTKHPKNTKAASKCRFIPINFSPQILRSNLFAL
jgi:hypothetical protein